MSTPALIAICFVAAFACLAGVSIWRYGSADAVKTITALTAFFGPILGASGTYFFTRSEVVTAQNTAADARNQAAVYKNQVASLNNAVSDLKATFSTLNAKPATYTLGELKLDDKYVEAEKQINGWNFSVVTPDQGKTDSSPWVHH